MDPLRGLSKEKIDEMMKNMKDAGPKQPDAPIPDVPEVPTLDTMGFLKTVQQSEHYNLVLVCFGCLFVTTFVAVLIFVRLRRTGDVDKEVRQKMATIARYARTLATTFSAGVPLVEALESVAGATGNVVYRNAVNKIRDDVSSGTQLNFSMKSAGVFPAMAVQMTAIGEESGALDTMLDKVATYYEDEVDNAVDGLTSLLEPLIMAVLGVLVGGLIIAMYLPIFQLGSVV